MNRHKRHATPGTMQLQEAKRKATGQQQQQVKQKQLQQPQQDTLNKRQVIHAMLKGQVVLACNLQPPDQDDSVSLVLWYKDKSMVPIYSVDARSASIQEARHKPGPWLEGRSSLKIFTQRTVIRNRRETNKKALKQNNSEIFVLANGGDNDDADNKLLADLTIIDQDEYRGWRRHHKKLMRRNYDELDKSLAKFSSTWSKYSPSGGHSETYVTMHELPMTSHMNNQPNNKPAAISTEILPTPMALITATPAESLVQQDHHNHNHRQQQQQQQQQLMAHLHIDSLSSEDNGVYLCRVDFRKARSRTQVSVLKIIVPAEKPSVRDLSVIQSGVPRPVDFGTVPSIQVLGPHNEASKVVFQCETQGGYPEPMLTWWRNGRLLDDSYEIVSALDGLVIAQYAGTMHSPGAVDGEDTLDEFRARVRLVGDEILAEDETNESLNELAGAFSPSSSSSSSSSSADAAEAEASHDQMDQVDGGTISQLATAIPSAVSPSSSLSSMKQVTQNRLIRNRLELNGLTRADLLANYSCQAWNTKLSEPPTTSIMIDMNLRPIKVQIDNERQPVLADKPLDVVCRAFGSRPAALITWWRGNAKLVPQQLERDSEKRGSHGQQQRASSGTGDESQPEAYYERGAGRDSFVQLRIHETLSTDSNVTISTLSIVPQLEDEGQIISCKAENPYIIQATSYPSPDAASSASNSGDGGGSIEDSWKLDVHYLPRVKLALGDKLNGQIKEGHDVYFECTTKAHPQVHEVRWWFNGRELETNVTFGIIISNQSLVLQRISRQQRGRYTCSAINSVGESYSNSVHLRVKYAPFCRDAQQQQQQQHDRPEGQQQQQLMQNDLFTTAISQQKFKTHYGAARLESVKVYCHIDADPIDSISYKWAFVATNGKQPNQRSSGSTNNGKPEFSGQQLVYLDSNSVTALAPENPLVSVATYTPRSELDYGTLLCWGQNALGEQSEPCAYQIVPAERPDPMRNCRLINASDTQLTVACEPGYDGGIDQSFQMEVYDTRKHELVANVSSSMGGGMVLWWPVTTTRDDNHSNTTGTGTGTVPSSVDDSTEGEVRSTSGNQPASLVSEPIVSRQQKQRHSLTHLKAAVSAGDSAGVGLGTTAVAAGSSGQTTQTNTAIETIFITEPNLSPATNYFLSIYSTNSKGSSKPVAFTATTMNLSSSDLAGLSSSVSSVRDGRRADPSYLLSDVLSLSWNPFLLVCAITIALFIMFASLTFAMMKYVDFSAAFSSSTQATTYGPCLSNATSITTNHNGGHKFDREQNHQYDRDEDDQSSSTTKSQQRVITVNTANSATISSDTAHNIPLNGMCQQKERSSLLDGSYLKFKIQQLTGQSPLKKQSTLKQSNSDNFLNQLGTNNQLHHRHSQQQQQQLRQQQSAHFCGTLPKNMSILQRNPIDNNNTANYHQHSSVGPISSSSLAFEDSDLIHHQVQMQNFENPYGAAKMGVSVAGSVSSEGATNYSGATNTSVHSPPALASATSSRPASIYCDGFPQMGEPRVEQLIISGKQYIHQTSAAPTNATNRNLYRHRQQQQQQQRQFGQQRHLQMTSCAPCRSLQQNNLYVPNSMKDYYHSQQQSCHENQKAPLVCISHRSMIGATQSLLVNDQVIDGVCLGAPGADALPQAVDILSYTSGTGPETAQHMNSSTQFTSENYPATIVANDSNSAINNSTSSSSNNNNNNNNNNDTGKTSDLGDELPPIECDSIPTNGAVCHVAHLALLDANEGVNLDSDGMSSGTQRSLLTNESPSSGIAKLDYEAQRRPQQQPYHHHQYLHQMAAGNCSQEAGSTSTIKSDQHESDVGGNVVSVAHGQPTADIQMISHSILKGPNSNSMRHAKKSLKSKEYLLGANNSDVIQDFKDPQLDQYMVYVEGNSINDHNNNGVGEFYMRPAQEADCYSNKARVRLVSGNERTLGYRATTNSQQLQSGVPLFVRSDEMAALVQCSANFTSSRESSEQRPSIIGVDIHTDV